MRVLWHKAWFDLWHNKGRPRFRDRRHHIRAPLANLLGRTMLDMELDYAFNWAAAAAWLAIVLGVSSLASVLPARDATRIRVRESLAYA